MKAPLNQQEMSNIEQYLANTGQSLEDLLAGESQYGPEYINDLIKQALTENKKIVFMPQLNDGVNLGKGKYELQPL